MKEIDAGIKIYLERYGQKLHVTVPSSEASYLGSFKLKETQLSMGKS